MAVTTIPWGDGSGDNIYLTYSSASGNQTVEVTSDANTGAARSKTVTFTSGVGSITKTLTVAQSAGARPCLTFSSTGTNTLSLTCNGTCAPVLYYSTDKANWTRWDYSALTITSAQPIYLYGDNTTGFSTSTSDYAQFVIGGSDNVSCSGSIATLINGTESLDEIPCTYCFYYLFYNCARLTSAPSLPSTTLRGYCYRSMFYGCSALTSAPTLPATTAVSNCYYYMFYHCTSLVTPPALPAETLGNYCYRGMFEGCTAMTTCPALPATTLATGCYQNMFYGCTKITTSPDLNALTLVSNCYYQMFRGASKLNYVKALFTTTPGSSYTSTWLTNVASSGTFVKNKNATWTNRGNSAVPNSWTIVTV